MNSIKYVVGDATAPKMDGAKIICHVCNNIAGWGKGFVLALSKSGRNQKPPTGSGIGTGTTMTSPSVPSSSCRSNLTFGWPT